MEAKQNGLNFEAEKARIESAIQAKATEKLANSMARKMFVAGMEPAAVTEMLEEKFPQLEGITAIRTEVRLRLIRGEIATAARRKAERAAKKAEKALKQEFKAARLEKLRDEYKGLHRQKYRERAGKFKGREDEIWVNQAHIGVPYLCTTSEAALTLAARIGDETGLKVEIFSVMAVKTLVKGGIQWVENYLDKSDRFGVYDPLMTPGRQMAGEMTGFPFWPDVTPIW